MTKIKRLDLPSYVDYYLHDEDFADKRPQRMPVIVGKDGWYYDRLSKVCWFEKDNEAWISDDPERFLYNLQQLNTKWLHPREVQAIKILIQEHNCPKNLKEMLWNHEANEHVRSTQREWGLFRLQMNKELLNEKK